MNNSLIEAKRKRDDEYYTRYEDVENELKHYKKYFKDKIVYCPCDSDNSAFTKYFQNNFKELGLKDFLHTSMVYGEDFRNQKELREKADIIVTNPPFSLLREFVDWCGDKDFIILGPNTSPTLNNIFEKFKNKKIKFGINIEKHPTFDTPNGPTNKVNISWITTFDIRKNEPLNLKEYNSSTYQKYDNYDAIEVPRVNLIPDYDGLMGVPFTFLEKWNYNQFEVVDIKRPFFNGKQKFARIIIKKI